jgi:SAM-dependent methyltransferase
MGKESNLGIPIKKFREAQIDEKDYWMQKRTEIISDKYRKYKKNAAIDILYKLQSTTDDGCLESLLEIGGGGDPMVEYFEGDIGVVIDPLGVFYKTEFLQSQLRSVEYFCGIGENLPFRSDSFDGVLLYNCIDHGIAPFKILDESKRVLRHGGAIHLLVDTYSFQYCVYRKIFEHIFPKKRDKKHPNCLRFKTVSKYMKDLGFVELKSYHGANPYSVVFGDFAIPNENAPKIILKGHRAVRAFYRLEDQLPQS